LLAEVSTSSTEIEAILGKISGNKDSENAYTVSTNVPHYQIVGEQPNPSELYDMTKCNELQAEIAGAEIPDEIREYLILASYRHVVFDYRKAAEYYPHASPEVQRLMENSALIIIDFESAIRNGYVKFSEALAHLEASDEHEA